MRPPYLRCMIWTNWNSHIIFWCIHEQVVLGIATGARAGALAEIMADDLEWIQDDTGHLQLDEIGTAPIYLATP